MPEPEPVVSTTSLTLANFLILTSF
jgi:hypothetical protein